MYEIINELCKKNNISITKLCEMITNSSGNLATWKKGYMRSDYLQKVAEYFNVSVDYLLGRTQEPNSQYYNIGNNNLNNNGNGTINNGTAIQQSDITAEMIEKFNSLCFESKVKVINLISELSQNKAG